MSTRTTEHTANPVLARVRQSEASSAERDENRWQGKPNPLRNHRAASRAAGAEARRRTGKEESFRPWRKYFFLTFRFVEFKKS
jgi:hypothetical protein